MADKNKTILIVEDEPALRKALREKLIREGFNVLEAKNGEEGLKIALEGEPDLILLDIFMPVMDGITMLNKLRADERGKNIRVIILTNLSEAEKISEAVKLGSYDYLVKTDWKIENVAEIIKEKLKMK